jgi:hypothetical protein
MAFASLLLPAGAILELAFAIAGSRIGEINGFTSGWVAAAYLEAVFHYSDDLASDPCGSPPLRRLLTNTLPLG